VQAFRRGFSGNFQNLISVTSKDNVQHYSAVYIRPHEQEIKSIRKFLNPHAQATP
jgi:hypothetical protein